MAQHGREALAFLRRPGAVYDVVLMDLQMPVMDGYQATAAIRQDPDLQTLPVLAMTAHAMVEERERCLALGMQGHVSKPLDPAALYAALRRYVPHERVPAPMPFAVSSLAAGDLAAGQSAAWPERAVASDWPEVPGLDRRQAEAYFAGDVALYRQTLAGFVEHVRDLLARLPEALASVDGALLSREGHTLKGLAGTIGHPVLAERARVLELAGANGERAEIERAAALVVDALVPWVDTLSQALLPAAAAALPSVPAQLDPSLVQRLGRLSADSDGQALSLWQRHRSAFAGCLPPSTFARLDDALARCDFDAASRLLQEWQPKAATAATATVHPESSPT